MFRPPPSHGIPALLDTLARASTRPRYAFMLLGLIGEVADSRGQAGPFVRSEGEARTLRDWLSDALTPMGARNARRRALSERVHAELARSGELPENCSDAARAVDAEVENRVRAAGKTNLSRAVSELVAAGLLRRHYQGYAIDHRNRGGQRHAVYTLAGPARCLIGSGKPSGPRPAAPAQLTLV